MISLYYFNIVVALVMWQLLAKVAAQQCGSHYSIFGMMLRGHTFKRLNTSISFECHQACHDDIRCQSFHYVIKKNVCELNNRTKEARPEDFVPDLHRYYFKRNKEIGELRLTKKKTMCSRWGENKLTKKQLNGNKIDCKRIRSSARFWHFKGAVSRRFSLLEKQINVLVLVGNPLTAA